MELLAHGSNIASVLLHTNSTQLPDAIVKYLFCCPSMDFNLRCLPSAGGFYEQRHRDFIEFAIIESRLRNIKSRNNA